MDPIAQRNDSDYYNQSDLLHNVNTFSPQNRSSVNMNSSGVIGYRSSMPNVTSGRMSVRPNEEGWKKSSSDRIITKMESWKMSGKPRHAQLQHVQEEDPRSKRQSAPLFNSPYHPKPLPQEPSPVIQHEPYYPPSVMDEQQAPFHITTPIQHHRPVYSHNEMYPPTTYPPTNEFVPPVDYHHYHQPQEYPPQNYPPHDQLYNEYSAPQPYNEYSAHPPQQPYNEYPIHDYLPQQPYNEYPPSVPDHSYAPVETHQLKDTPVQPLKTEEKPQKKKDAKPEKKVRQITVQSINIEHRVWIDVLPTETGLSLAEKIHIIATFRTRKIVSITSASGRKVPLDNRPVFGSWMDMESFEDGERWTVEWKENDRGVVDRFMSKIVQGKRRD